MKLNLGCGDKKMEGYVNVDNDPRVQPDVLLDLEKDKWIWENDSVDEIVAHHILEHLGDGYFHFLQEMYRVGKDGAIIHVLVPHPRHDVFLNDPTHKRPITVEGLTMFNKSINRGWIASGDHSSKLGLLYDVNFELIDVKYAFDPFYREEVEAQPEDKRDAYLGRLARERNNVIIELFITLMVVKNEDIGNE
jgi:hypothetical protein